jgi:hypothetical protein
VGYCLRSHQFSRSVVVGSKLYHIPHFISIHSGLTLPPLYFTTNLTWKGWTVPWLRRLVAGLSPGRTGFDPVSVHVGFVVDKVVLGQVFPRVNWKTKKLIIFITRLHNKPQGCDASVASAAGSFNTKKTWKGWNASKATDWLRFS